MNKDTQRKIEKYLQKQLEGIELRRFEDQLEKDEVLRKRVKLEQELNEVLSDKSDFNIFRRIVNETSTDYFNKKSSSGFSPLKIAATVALLISASWIIWTLSTPSTPDEIYNEFFEPYVIQTTPRGLTEDTDTYMLGTIHYRDGEYASAIIQFEILLTETPNDYRAQLMLAISYMALKDFKSAEDVLIRLVNDPNHLFQDQARWYLGLLYLIDGDKENDWKADEYFEEIEDTAIKKKAENLN
ncbi:tetratricopeptide repeat protein [Ekhidna sp.]|uniref:tetratricopeptide repeat protein n=1 Tax=Ekhidna sp. TaxID=2608089 RepID=UPI00329A15BE